MSADAHYTYSISIVLCCGMMGCILAKNLGAKMTADHLKSVGSPNLHGDYELRMRCGISLFSCDVDTCMYLWYLLTTLVVFIISAALLQSSSCLRAPYQTGTDSFANPGAW